MTEGMDFSLCLYAAKYQTVQNPEGSNNPSAVIPAKAGIHAYVL